MHLHFKLAHCRAMLDDGDALGPACQLSRHLCATQTCCFPSKHPSSSNLTKAWGSFCTPLSPKHHHKLTANVSHCLHSHPASHLTVTAASSCKEQQGCIVRRKQQTTTNSNNNFPRALAAAVISAVVKICS